MKEMKFDKKCKGHNLITFLGIIVLALAMLVNIAGAAPYAYITNYGTNSVSVIDTVTDNVTATVPVGSYPGGVVVQ